MNDTHRTYTSSTSAAPQFWPRTAEAYCAPSSLLPKSTRTIILCASHHYDGVVLPCQYLAGLYWTIATLMSVGYGDISADTNHERLYALVTMVSLPAFLGL